MLRFVALRERNIAARIAGTAAATFVLLVLTGASCAAGDVITYVEWTLSEQEKRDLVVAAVEFWPEVTEHSPVDAIRANARMGSPTLNATDAAAPRTPEYVEGAVSFAPFVTGDIRVSLAVRCRKPAALGDWHCVSFHRAADHPAAGGKPAFTLSREAYFGDDGSVEADLLLEAEYSVRGQAEPVEFSRNAHYRGNRALDEVWQLPDGKFVNGWAKRFARLVEAEFKTILYLQPAERLRIDAVMISDGFENVTGSIGSCAVHAGSDAPGGTLRLSTPRCSLPEPDLSKPKRAGAGIVSATPQGGHVDPTTAIRVMFSEDIESCMTSGWRGLLSVRSGKRFSPLSEALVTYSDNTLTLSPVDTLEYDTRYTVSVGSHLIDPECRFIDPNFTWIFRTRALLPES